MLMRLLLLAFGVCTLLALGCGGSGGLTTPIPSGADTDVSERRLRESIRRAGRSDSMLALTLSARGLTPVFGRRFQLGPGRLAGFIPGHYPGRAGELIVVGAERGTLGTAALLEAARVITARAAFSSQPHRTILVAFWPSGSEGLRQVLQAPVWDSSAVHSVWVVAGDSLQLQAQVQQLGVAGGVIGDAASGNSGFEDALQLTTAILDRLDREANGPADSLRTSPP